MFGISTNNLPSRWNFKDYTAALAYHDSIRPTRTDGRRPLATNRRGPFTIQQHPRTKAIELVLYSTEVITINPSDTLDLDLTFNSNPTRAFAQALTPSWVSIYAERNHNVVRCNGKSYFTDKASFDLSTSQMISGKTRLEQRVVNRKRAKPVQTILEAILGVIDMAEAVNPDFISDLRKTYPIYYYNINAADTLAINLDDSDTYLPLITKLSYIPTWRKHLKELLYKAHEVYDCIPIADGVLPPRSATFRFTGEQDV